MISPSLNRFPTCENLYSKLSAIPCFIQHVPNAKDSFSGYKVSFHSFEDEKGPNGLMVFLNGNFITSSIVEGAKDEKCIWTTFQGDNQFALKTVRKVDGEKVTITTSLNNGSTNELLKQIHEIDEKSNATVVKQTFIKMGESNDAKLISSEILSTGFNKVGKSIPTFADSNVFADGLQRIYSTADFTKKAKVNPSKILLTEFESIGAFWDSWGDGIKAAVTVAGGVAGGIIGGAAGAVTGGIATPAGAIGGAAAGASLAEGVYNLFS